VLLDATVEDAALVSVVEAVPSVLAHAARPAIARVASE
jgi:hypothetical protein